jgi:hypothetical protein
MKDFMQCAFVIPDKNAIVDALEGKRAEKVAALTIDKREDVVTVTGVIPLKNTHPNPGNNYAVSGMRLRTFNSREIILVHSHPKDHHDSGPSPEDIAGLSVPYGGVYVPGVKLLVLFTRNATRTISLK